MRGGQRVPTPSHSVAVCGKGTAGRTQGVVHEQCSSC